MKAKNSWGAKQPINNWLSDYMRHSEEVTSGHDLLKQVAVLVNHGGKRLRPLTCMLAYKGYSGKDQADVLPAAGALELLHTFLLMHDDIIDRDLQRWGGPNITGVYFERYSTTMTSQDALHAAEAQAIIAGDICQTLATQALLQTKTSPEQLTAIQKLYNDVVLQVLRGELSDISFSNDKLPSRDEILQMYINKTASYTFVLPLQMGAVLAGAPSSEQKILQTIGKNLGIAYQLQDDLLGMFGDEANTGKPIGSDLREGKQTLMMVIALEQASAADRAVLLQLLGDPSVNAKHLTSARTIITRSGAHAIITDLVQSYSQQAIEDIQKTKLTPDGKQQLTELATSLLTRDH